MSSALKSLSFTTLQKPSTNPVLDRRARTIARLEEQKLLLADPNYTRTVRTWAKDDVGKKRLVESKQRVLPWWVTQPNGSLGFFLRFGWKEIDFEKGKAAISAASLDKLPPIIDTVITAVRNGELDEQLAHASAQVTRPKTKRKTA